MTNYNILLVDDILLNRRILKAALSVLPNMNFFEASDGAAALGVILERKIDLVILDLVMPGKSGYEVVNEIKAKANVSDIPIIVYSAVSDAAVVSKIREMGIYDYLVKPLNAEELRTLLPEKIKAALNWPEAAENTDDTAGLPDADGHVGCLTQEELAEYKRQMSQIDKLTAKIAGIAKMNEEELRECLDALLNIELKNQRQRIEKWKVDRIGQIARDKGQIEIDMANGKIFLAEG